jgi:hypothetical protein
MVVYTLNPILGRLRQEDWEFLVSLNYIVRHCLKNKKPKPNTKVRRWQSI